MAKLRGQDQIEASIEAISDNLVERLELGWLRIVHRYETRADGERVVAEAVADWEYRQVSIVWSVGVALTLSNDELRRVLLHELIHAMIAPLWVELPDALQGKLAKHNELATENVARMVLSALG